MATYTSTITGGGAEIDRRLEYVKYLEQLNDAPVGIKWDSSSSSPTLTRIDINGNTLTTSATFFDNHKIWGGIRRCVRNRSTGAISYGTDNAGTGLTLDGSTGDVLVEIPSAKYKFSKVGNIYYFWLIPYSEEDVTYTTHPAANQRSTTTTSVKSKIYVGAYEASIRDDAGTLKLQSVSGVQPWTGTAIKSIAFTSGGTTEIVIGETLTGATSSATGIVVAYHAASGTWAGGDAEGTIYLKQVSGTFQSENLNGSTAGSNCATVGGDAAAVSLTMDQAEGYGNAIGTGCGICNVWTYVYLQLLMYIEYGTYNLQTALGRGIVDLVQGTGFAGKTTGYDSIDSELGTNGTGVGTGTDGETPVCWRGIENLWGNCWEFMIGLNMNLSDGSYTILKRDGLGTPAATLAGGSYETGTGTVPVSADGYISGLQTDEMGALAFIPAADAGSSSTYTCDYYYKPTASPSCVRGSAHWFAASNAGPAYRSAAYASTGSGASAGCRIEYLV